MTLRRIAPPILANNDVYVGGPLVGQATKLPPNAGLRTEGHRPETRPSAQQMNYELHHLARHAAYVDAIDVSNVRASARAWDDAAFALAAVPQVRSRYAVTWRGYTQEIFACGPHAGGTKYVAFSGDGGRRWDAVDLPAGGDDIISIAFSSTLTAAGDRGYAAGANGGGMYWDGSDFAADPIPNANVISGVIYAPGAVEEFLIFGSKTDAGGGAGVWSSNGDPATQRTVPTLASHVMRDVVWGGAGVGALGVSDNGSTTRIWTSTTGAVWVDTSVSAGGAGVRIAYDEANEWWVRIAGNGTGIQTSYDGVTWTAAAGALPGATPFPRGHRVDQILCRGGVWIVVTRWSSGTNRPVLVWTSTDLGATWQLGVVEVGNVGNQPVTATWIEGETKRLAVASETSIALGLRAR